MKVQVLLSVIFGVISMIFAAPTSSGTAGDLEKGLLTAGRGAYNNYDSYAYRPNNYGYQPYNNYGYKSYNYDYKPYNYEYKTYSYGYQPYNNYGYKTYNYDYKPSYGYSY